MSVAVDGGVGASLSLIRRALSCQWCAIEVLTLGGVTGLATQDPAIRPFLDWSQQRKLNAAVTMHGLAAEVPGMSVPAFLRAVLDRANDALKARGMGEEVYLRPLYRRLKEGRNPGQTAALCFKEQGAAAAIQHLSIPVFKL
jgi:hypothetical protein